MSIKIIHSLETNETLRKQLFDVSISYNDFGVFVLIIWFGIFIVDTR